MEYFKTVGKIDYEGPGSRNPLAFKWYDQNREVRGKTMKEHLRYAVAYWHSFCGTGSDPFGPGTRSFPWDEPSGELEKAKRRLDAAFEFMVKLGVPFYCFHDTDLVGDGSVFDIEKRLEKILPAAKQLQHDTGIRLLWGTANIFSNPRYMNGAATNPDFVVLTNAAVQVKNAIEATIELGGRNYVFWGGREGYLSLHNTDTRKELEHLGMFLSLARDHGRKKGFTGTFLVEPKPMEPTKHQYDYDASTVIGFILKHQLQRDFKLNVEVNHATLAGHSFAHEIRMAADAGLFGSVDANKGDYQNGWDTDEFPTNLYEVTEAMLEILQAGGFTDGGINFDAKLRRNSTDAEDLFIAHVSGMDTFARALIISDRILHESDYLAKKQQRYHSFSSAEGVAFEQGTLSLEELCRIAGNHPEPQQVSGKQEYLEQLINAFI
jgi:xylose isomerase